jgi:hypothetical protein
MPGGRIVAIHGIIEGSGASPIQKGAIFCTVKIIEDLRRGLPLQAHKRLRRPVVPWRD